MNQLATLRRSRTWRWIGLISLALACRPSAPTPSEPTLVVLVRHAEREDQLLPGDAPTGPDGALRGTPDDPALSRHGQERAGLIASLLADAGLDEVWSTDYLRTRETASPAADAGGLAINAYDPSDLPAFAATLTGMGGRHLVVGHSNTTPELVAALGGDPGSAIDEYEYDRLYVVSVFRNSATTTLLRFGESFTGPSGPS